MNMRHERGTRPNTTALLPLRPVRRMVQLAAACTLIGGLAFAGAFASSTPAMAVTAEDSAPSTPSAAPTTEDVISPDAEPGAEPVSPELPADPAPPEEPPEVEWKVSPDTASLDDTAIAPMSVPAPDAGSALISVRVAGTRLADGTVSGLAGVQLALYGPGTLTVSTSAGSSLTQGVAGNRYSAAWPWTTCVSDANGDCNFQVPVRSGTISLSGVPQDTRFWIVQEASPTGWYANPMLRVGNFGASPEFSWAYRFQTDSLLRAGATYQSTTPMAWDPPTNPADRETSASANPNFNFMRNRDDTNAESGYASNVTRTTGNWSQSLNNPALPNRCGLDIAFVTDTSGSLGASGVLELKNAMTNIVDAFLGTNTRMALFSFSNSTPSDGGTNNPALLPVTTSAQATTFKQQYSGWLPGGGTNWDLGLAAAANATPHYDVVFMLTDGNPTVNRTFVGANNPSAYNSIRDVDAGIFSANQLKAEGTRVIALGAGPGLTPASDVNLRSVSGPTKGTDYFNEANFAAAAAQVISAINAKCAGTIGVQKMIVPNGGTIADATPAPAGWQFDASSPLLLPAIVSAPTSQTTVLGGDGKVDFGLTFLPFTSSGNVQILETQQSGYSLVPVGTGAAARNAVCTNVSTNASVPVTDAGTAATPGFIVTGQLDQRVECKIYNRAPVPGNLEIAKTANPVTGTQVTPGQNVSYTLTFRNTGGAPIAVAHDDVLTDVLDDATLQGAIVAQSPLAAVLNAAGDRILITGTLAPGDIKTVTYTVKVKDPLSATSNGKLGNYVVKTGVTPPTTCAPTDPCTVHPIVGRLIWNKVDATYVKLAGSEWTLTPYNAQGQLVPADTITVIDCVAASAAACTGPDKDPHAGEFLLEKLKLGKYQLVETKAPAGFQMLPNPIDVVVNTNVSLGNIKNLQIEVPPIPLTGGVGSYLFWGTAGGIGVVIAAALWYQRRRTQAIA